MLNFIIKLLYLLHQQCTCNVILNVIDHYSQKIIHISTTSDIFVSEFTELIEQEVITYYEILKSIISD